MFDLSFPDPDEVSDELHASSELIDMLKSNVRRSNHKFFEWINITYKVSFESIPKRE